MNNKHFYDDTIVASQPAQAQVEADTSSTNSPIILQNSLLEFEAAICQEFLDSSAIDRELFEAAIRIVPDTETGYGGELSTPIHDALGWQHSGKKSFGKPTLCAALFQNEDGSIWQAKLSQQSWDAKKGRYSKPYKAPKGNGARAYLPSIPAKIRQVIGQRNKVDVLLDGPFWDWIEAHPEIPIVITEGGKKSLALLSLGYVAIAIYGCHAGATKNQDGTHDLIPDLERFCQSGRELVIALDRDEKPETAKSVACHFPPR